MGSGSSDNVLLREYFPVRFSIDAEVGRAIMLLVSLMDLGSEGIVKEEKEDVEAGRSRRWEDSLYMPGTTSMTTYVPLLS